MDNRRSFLKFFGASSIPFFLPISHLQSLTAAEITPNRPAFDSQPTVNFIFDGLFMSPHEYLNKLQEINTAQAIETDFYGNGGAVKSLEDKFAQLSGKEKAIYLPSGTMANQLAIKLLNGNNTKVIVPENSHIFRDEADAAQSVHNKRLIPVGKDKAYFNLTDLQNTIGYLDSNEVFKSGLGTIAIENPVRRADGSYVPLETIKEIADYCQEHGYKMHLDGARIHIASAYSKISLAEYASHFDTVYISLYKYLHAAGGAILCGDAEIIDQIGHQIKILGGTVFQNWMNAAMALHYLEGIGERWEKSVATASTFIGALNTIEGVSIKHLTNGTNIYDLTLSEEISLKKLANFLYHEHQMILGRANEEGIVKFTINESLLMRDTGKMLDAFEQGIKQAKG